MESSFFERAYPLALDLLSKGNDLSKLFALNKDLNKDAVLFPSASDRDRGTGMSLFRSANGLKIGMFRISGGITKTGDLCSNGSRDYSRIIEAANKSEGIDAIVDPIRILHGGNVRLRNGSERPMLAAEFFPIVGLFSFPCSLRH